MPFYPNRPLRLIMAGGLGNQLFQLYAGLDFAIKTDRRLVLDYSQFQNGYTKREELIPQDILDSIYHNVTISKKRKAVTIMNLVDRAVLRSMRLLGVQRFLWRGRSIEVGFSSNSRFLKASTISGYFQTWKHYTSLAESKSVTEVYLRDPSENFKNWDAKICAEKPVIVHIRRGDYKSLREKWGVLGFEYFSAGILALLEKSPSQKILVFSDEPIEAQQLFEDGTFLNVEYFPTGSLRNDFEELILMGRSDKLVISNSTYSWWAAELGGTRYVAAPTKWFRGMEDPVDLIPSSWILIPSSWEIGYTNIEEITDGKYGRLKAKESN